MLRKFGKNGQIDKFEQQHLRTFLNEYNRSVK